MKLKDLIKDIQGTTIQKEEQIKKFIDSEIEIPTDISNIDDRTIHISLVPFTYGDIFDYDNAINEKNLSIDIQYDKGLFGTQLLSYSFGDRVHIIARLKRASFGYNSSYEFELVSIRKISTMKERLQAEKEAKDKKASACFIATATYGSALGPEVSTLRQFRDDVLLCSRLGRTFVGFYYFASPPLASLISKDERLQALTRRFLLEPILHFIKNTKSKKTN